MNPLNESFEERLQEIDTYLDFLGALEIAVRAGPPRIGADGPVISTDQQRILYSSVYLQLYNLVEATITKCIDAVCSAVTDGRRWKPSDLSERLRGEWVRYLASTHEELSYDKRLIRSMAVCEHLIQTLPIDELEIERGGGGNWDDEEIYRFITKRLGCTFEVDLNIQAGVKKPFRNNKGALALIVQLRNDLAHGKVSFLECGADATVDDLRELKVRSAQYLQEVVNRFSSFIGKYEFLAPDKRPAEETA